MSRIAFIPGSISSAWLSAGFSEEVCKAFKAKTGATSVEFHDHVSECDCCSKHWNPSFPNSGITHIVLSDPTMSMREIEKEFANSFSKSSPVWDLDFDLQKTMGKDFKL